MQIPSLGGLRERGYWRSDEAILQRSSGHPVAVTGIVENGLVKPLDPAVRLPEHARVIIVTSLGG